MSSSSSHKLDLEYAERRALEFVGYRYFCGDDLIDCLLDCPIDVNEDDVESGLTEDDACELWSENRSLVFRPDRNQALHICHLIESDLDGGNASHAVHVLLGGELWAKLITFQNGVYQHVYGN